MKRWAIASAIVSDVACRLRRVCATGIVAVVSLCPASVLSQVEPGTAANGAIIREVQIAAEAFSLGQPVPAWVEPVSAPETTQSRPIVIRVADTQFMVGERVVTYVHRAIKVNDPGALTEIGRIPIDFAPQYQRLQLHAVRILRGQEILDRTRSSTIHFLQREIGLEQGIHSGVVTASVVVNDVRVGDTLEYSYTVDGHNPVMGERFFDQASWDQPFPVELRRVIVIHPASRNIRWKFLGDARPAAPSPRQSIDGALRRLTFEEKAIPEVLVEPHTPPDYMPYRWLQFSEFSEWSEVAVWADGLFRNVAPASEDLRQIVEKIRLLPTVERRVAAALEFVQSEIRYFSILLGESSHRPTQPDVVLRRRYGDCKDKTFLLMTLLKELGIASRPVLVSLRMRTGLDKMLPSPQAFDHVILQVTVDGATLYLDPTRIAQLGRLSRMGQAHEGAQVLLVAPETRALTTIATRNLSELVRDELSEVAILSRLGREGQLESRQVWHGLGAEVMRAVRSRVSREQFATGLAAQVERRYPGATLVGEVEVQDDNTENILSVTARYKVPNLAAERGGAWFVRLSPGNIAGTFALPPSAGRSAPVAVPGFPLEARYTLEVRFPEQVRALRDPQTHAVRNKHFSFSVAASFRGNVARTSVELRTLAPRVEVADLQQFVEDVRRAGALPGSGAIVVTKGEIRTEGLLSLGRGDFKDTVSRRLEDTVTNITSTIGSAKLAGNDLAAAHCDRSSAYSSLGRHEEALRDANEGVKLASSSAEMLACRAAANFGAGDFQRSLADYSKALALGATEANTYYRRGLAKFYLGRLEDAGEDLLKASEIESDESSRLYIDLWLLSTLKRLERPIPPALAARAAARPDGEWPRPALAMMAGQLQPEQMLKLLGRKNGDDLVMAQAEGYFFLGQFYLIQGDAARARKFFESTRELGVKVYTEHVAAGFELARLNGR